ncbi:MAG: CAAX prenyl protease-related protein [Massilia sp.]
MPTRPTLARCLPFALYLAFIAIAELLAWLGFTPQQLLWLYPVKIAAVVAALAYFWRDYEELRSNITTKQALIAIITGIVVLILWLNLGAAWMTIGSASGYDPRSDGAIDWLLVAIRIAGAALVVPVMEELFWRSFVLRWLDRPDFSSVSPGAVSVKAIAISSLLFGVEHNLWFAGLVAGLAYALLYRRHQRLWSPILAHGVTNGLLGLYVVATNSWQYW